MQKLSARYIQFRVIKNVIYICNLLSLTKNCCFCICMPFGCSRVCGTPPPLYRYYEFNNKGYGCKSLYQWKHECIRCFFEESFRYQVKTWFRFWFNLQTKQCFNVHGPLVRMQSTSAAFARSTPSQCPRGLEDMCLSHKYVRVICAELRVPSAEEEKPV